MLDSVTGVSELMTTDRINEATATVLRIALTEAGIAHNRVAAAYGVGPTQMSKWLGKAKRGTIPLRLVFVVADMCHVSASDLIARVAQRVEGESVADSGEIDF